MKKIILLLMLLVPGFAFAAEVSIGSIIGSLPNFARKVETSSRSLLDLFSTLDQGTRPDGADIESADTTGRALSHQEYIKQLILSSGSTLDEPSESIADVAARIFGSKVRGSHKLKDCLKVGFAKSWSNGQHGDGIVQIQKFLNQNVRTQIAEDGIGSKGKETKYYGALTVDAVKRFQTLFAKDILESVGLSEPTGFWGPSTIKKANEITALCK